MMISSTLFYKKTATGLAFAVIGENQRAADSVGIPVHLYQYIALAAVILGRYTPIGMLGAALIFGGANALQIRLQALGVPLPPQALSMLPYIITLIALLGSVGRSNAPDSLGKPYVRGVR